MMEVAVQGGGWEISPWVGKGWEELEGGKSWNVGRGREELEGEDFPFFVPSRFSSSPPCPVLGTKNDQQLFASEAASKLPISLTPKHVS